MAIVRLGDVIQPTVFTAYTQQKTLEKSALVQSGIVEHNAEFDTLASGPNTLVDMPYWTDLTGDSEVMSDDGFLTPGKIGTAQDTAKKHGRGRAWGANGLSALLSGDDPMGAIGDRVADYWVREDQKLLLATLKGVFADDKMSGHIHDISTETADGALLSGATFVDSTQLLGDAKDILTGVMMHSAIEAYLVKRQLIEYKDTVNELNQTIKVPYFMGKRVIVDDAMPFTPADLIGEMYLFGQGAIAKGNGTHPNIIQTEVDRDPLASSGEDILVTRRVFMLHPRGIKWTNSVVAKAPFPTNAEIADGANWERVYDPKAIRIVKFKFKITL
ncbi:major capsid protein [Bacillus phage vB_BcM_Sam46]|uniref:Major capsid protein n=2 Tax=Caudoviricetes TaxID=2731619 RepID=A0A6G9L6Y3_9CAUD|nr:major capsid protein [Bacillus phage vB_BcM_Sam112]QIQ61207.1 major capsid protein [Bacillus phage vB_BcM_Sam46]